MPRLSNQKYEVFAQKYVQTNGSLRRSMEEAGYKWSSSYASQLKNKPQISARITEIQKSAVTSKILNLEQRLEILSDIARDVTVHKNTRIRALHEIYVQCGDAVDRVSVNLTARTESIIKFVEVHLPAVTQVEDNAEITGSELESLDEFLKDA